MIFDESGAIEENDTSEVDDDDPNPKPPLSLGRDPGIERTSRTQHASINGRMYGNLAGLDMNEGERVRWYLFGLGSEKDFHTAHWHGLTVLEEGRRTTDVVELLPATMKVADMRASNPGTWLFHCHVAEHMQGGMFARYTVHSKENPGASRIPNAAFFGMPQSWQALRITKATWKPAAENTKMQGEFHLEAALTSFEALSLPKQSLQLELNGTKVEFQLDGAGRFRGESKAFEVTRVIPSGTSSTGGTVDFVANFLTSDWRAVDPMEIKLWVGRHCYSSQASVIRETGQ